MSGAWILTKDGDVKARAIYERHYSCYKYADGRRPKKFVGPGEYMALVHLDSELQYDALFVWRVFISMDHQQGINCAIFRNESSIRSSDLILQAEELAYKRWGRRRLYTYVNPGKIRSRNPGYCFVCAGWHKCGLTKGGLIVLEKCAADTMVIDKTAHNSASTQNAQLALKLDL